MPPWNFDFGEAMKTLRDAAQQFEQLLTLVRMLDERTRRIEAALDVLRHQPGDVL